MASIYSSGKLVIVSNRLPFVLKKNKDTQQWERKPSAGGLVTAVAPVVIKGNGFWIGWTGTYLKKDEHIPESDLTDNSPTAGLRSNRIIPVNLDPQTFDSYYNGCCNGTLWPLFHSMPDKAQFSLDAWKSYCAVNEQFAYKTVGAFDILIKQNVVYDEMPIAWLHDYHLMLAANSIRNIADGKKMKFKLGFFLHIPFPSWDIFRLFPWANDILQGLLGCDIIGFHIENYCLNFVDCCQRGLGCHVDRKHLLVEHSGRLVRIRALPIGIPFDRFADMAKKAPKVITTPLKLVLAVDRLDYTKGLVHRLKAFELLLEQYPQHKGKVILMQIAVPSRIDVKEYQDLKEEIDQLIGRINGRFTTPNWSPIKYIYGYVNQNELTAFYRDSAVAMVTPLRDGMNLVAKEFVACQVEEPFGVLILSPFAGAGEMMREALICNPYELDEAASTLHKALTMPEDEIHLRMKCLRRREKINDVNHWMQLFLDAMDALISEDGNDVLPTAFQPVTFQNFDHYLSKYMSHANKLALMLDYDGTLAPLASHPDCAKLPLETKHILERLANTPNIFISIISGRNVHNVKKMVGIEGLTYAGNHGLEILHPDGSIFKHAIPKKYLNGINILFEKLKKKVCNKGAWVEHKGSSLTFHYRKVPVDEQAEFKTVVHLLIEEAGFTASKAHCAIEAKPPVNWNKGRASLYILNKTFGPEWIENVRVIYAGDDVTDEDAMQALKGLAATFRVTQSQIVRTLADHCLPNTESVLTMLKWVEQNANKFLIPNDSKDNLNNNF